MKNGNMALLGYRIVADREGKGRRIPLSRPPPSCMGVLRRDAETSDKSR